MDLPLQNVHAAIPVTPRRNGNSLAITIPKQYANHQLLLIVLEKPTPEPRP